MLHVKTYVAKSNLHGMGLFAAEPIKKGTVIWEFTPGCDSVLPENTVEWLPPVLKDYWIKYAYKDGDNYVACLDDAKLMNHSTTPNTINPLVTDDRKNEQTLASKDIEIGEEITCDYFEFDGDADRKLTIDQ